MTLSDLADRIEGLDGPSRVTDVEVHLAAFGDRPFGQDGPPNNPRPGTLSGYLETYRSVINSDDLDDLCPRYTASLDAAMTLVPEGLRPVITTLGEKPIARLWSGDRSDVISRAEATTPALALCAAALRARDMESDGALD